jgi:hypothetical protein
MHTSASFFFKAVPELLYNKVINEGTKNQIDNTRLRTALKDAAMDLLFGPQPIPTGVRAPLEIALNHDFFTGSTVVPRGKEGLDAARQYNASTSELGKVMSKASGGVLNPIQMDHLMRGLTGTVGMAVMWGSNMFSGERPTEEARKNPFYGSFIMPEVPRGNEALYYDFKERSEEAYKTYTDLAKKQHKVEAQKWFDDHKVMIQGYGYTSGVETDLKSINGEIDRLSDLPSEKMSGEEKRTRINRLKEKKNEILQDVIAMRVRAGL